MDEHKAVGLARYGATELCSRGLMACLLRCGPPGARERALRSIRSRGWNAQGKVCMVTVTPELGWMARPKHGMPTQLRGGAPRSAMKRWPRIIWVSDEGSMALARLRQA